MNEIWSDNELGRILFAELLNRNGCNTGVDVDKFIEEYINGFAIKNYDKMEEPMTTIKALEEKEEEEDLKGLDEPSYYAGNGLSPLEAFKKGLLSREELIGFCKGNVIKYTVRAGHKHNASEDIVKAIDYLTHLKSLYEEEMEILKW